MSLRGRHLAVETDMFDRFPRCPARTLLLLVVLALFGSCSFERENEFDPITNRIFMFGLDGATWDVIDPLLAAGRLPNLQKLIDEGVRAPLQTLDPTYSPRIWTTIATGVEPEDHGILFFAVRDPRTREWAGLPSSDMRKVDAIWNILGEYGYSVGVVNWWASHPAEEVNGFIISDRACHIQTRLLQDIYELNDSAVSEHAPGFTHPENLYGEIDQILKVPDRIDSELLAKVVSLPPDLVAELQAQPTFSRDSQLSVLKFMLLQDESLTIAGLHALRKFEPDFMAFYLNGLDGVEHHFWKFLEPDKFNDVPQDEVDLLGDVIENYYVYMDNVLGGFLEHYSDTDLTVIVVSDHGHEAEMAHGTEAAVGYAKDASGTHGPQTDGILILSGAGIRKGESVDRPSVRDITPTLLALMGVPIGGDMSGRPLVEALEPDFLRQHPLRSIPTHTVDREYVDDPFESEADEAIREKLRSLGYIN